MHGSTQALDVQELLRHLDWVRSLARELVRDPHAAEDVAQETYRLALERPARDAKNPRGWLGAIARNVAAGFGRARDRRAAREHALARPVEQASPAELAADADLARALAEAVLELDEPYRSAIVLRHLRGESIERIARTTGVKPNSVRSHLARGLELLRAKLDRSRGGRAAWLSALLPLAGEAALAPAKATFAVKGLAAAFVAVLAFIVGLGAWLVTQGVEREPWSAARAALVAPEEQEEEREAIASASRAPRVREAAARALTIPRDASGVLELEFVEPDGTAARGIAYAVWCERRGNRVFGHGVSDERGRALCTELPEDVYLVQTERRGGTACGFRGVRLPRGGIERVTVELPRGRAASGRVVDEHGLPRAGIEVVLPGGPAAWRPVKGLPRHDVVIAAHTGADGRFRVEHLRSLPETMWIVDGRERPERRRDPSIHAREARFGESSGLSKQVVGLESGDVELGDFVVPRGFEISGIVVDEHGRPIAGALVTGNPSRHVEVEGYGSVSNAPAFMPGASGFALRKCETLADSAGRFLLALPIPEPARRNAPLLAVTPGGARGEFEFDRIEPGGRIEEARIVVALDTFVVLRLVDGAGRQVELPRIRRDGGRARLHGPREFESAFGQVRLRAQFADTSERKFQVRFDPDGRLRCTLGSAPQDVRTLEVEVPGWAAAAFELPQGLVAGVDQVFEFVPNPVLRATLRWKDGRAPDVIQDVTVHACLLAELPESVPDALARCCGLGSSIEVFRGSEAEPLELPVETLGPFYLHVTAERLGERLVPQRFGPFLPGVTVHAIELTPDIAPIEDAPALVPEVEGASGRAEVRLTVVDAASGKALNWSLSMRRPGAGPLALGHGDWNGTNTLPVRVPVGTWDFRVHAPGRRSRALGVRSLLPGEDLDFGQVALDPLPVFRGRIAGPGGAPWGLGAMLSCKQGSMRIDAKGRFEFTGEFDSDIVLLLMAESRGAGEFSPGPMPAHAWFHVTEWKDGEELVLAAPEFRNVRVRVEGIPPEHRDATLRVLLRPPVEGTKLSVPGLEQAGGAVRELRFRVAVGRWLLTPYCPLHPMAERTIDVPPGEDEFVVELRAR